MEKRTLKEVAQAGLVLGFEWITHNTEDGFTCLYEKVEPWFDGEDQCWVNHGYLTIRKMEITDFPDLPPEKSLLKLRDIVEGAE